MSDQDIFRAALNEESDLPLTDEIYRIITENSETLSFKKGETIVNIGDLNPDIYFIKNGIVRGYMINDGIETNIYFGMEGTMITSMQSFSMGQPAIMCIEVCSPTTVIRIRKPIFDKLMDESFEFCRWIGGVFSRRSFYDELKAKVMNGNAKWRYEWLKRCRPELFDNVPLKAIASYLKMPEVHVSRIRKEIAKGCKS